MKNYILIIKAYCTFIYNTLTITFGHVEIAQILISLGQQRELIQAPILYVIPKKIVPRC